MYIGAPNGGYARGYQEFSAWFTGRIQLVVATVL
jgi:hypothetical protein